MQQPCLTRVKGVQVSLMATAAQAEAVFYPHANPRVVCDRNAGFSADQQGEFAGADRLPYRARNATAMAMATQGGAGRGGALWGNTPGGMA